MHVVLVQLPFPILPEEPRHLSPPLGLAYLAAAVEASEHSVSIVDAVLEGYGETWTLNSDQKAYGLKPKLIAERIAEEKPDLVGISCLFSTQDRLLMASVEAIKMFMPDIPIVLGGTHPTVFAREFVENETVDFVVGGEGERALVLLLEAMQGNITLKEVSGLTWNDGGAVRCNAISRCRNLDELQPPARHLLNLKAYADVHVMHGESPGNMPATTIFTSRGCSASCFFCSIHPVWGGRFRAHSIERVLAEISGLYEEYGIRHLLIEDDNFTWDLDRAKGILRGLIANWPDISWSAPNGVAIWRMDDELLALIADSGCRRLSIAVESGCQRTLDHVIHKPLKLEHVDQVVASCRQYGIRTTAFFVLGTPGETRADMMESMHFAENLDVDTISIMTAVPLPGSALYDQAIAEGWIAKDATFSSYNTRNPILKTSEICPEFVNSLARKTMIRHALKHPRGFIGRVVEKARTSPKSTMVAIARNISASLRG